MMLVKKRLISLAVGVVLEVEKLDLKVEFWNVTATYGFVNTND